MTERSHLCPRNLGIKSKCIRNQRQLPRHSTFQGRLSLTRVCFQTKTDGDDTYHSSSSGHKAQSG